MGSTYAKHRLVAERQVVHSSRRLESEIESWWTKSTGYETEFEKGFRRLSRKYGGWENSHLHLNRVFVNGPKYLPATGLGTAKLSLKQKQSLVASVHKNQNYKADLVQRMGCALAIMKSLGTREVLAAIDVAPSCGLKEINAALKIKRKLAGKINLQIGAYPVAGLGSTHDGRWKLFLQAARYADFICTLPEKDDLAGGMGSKKSMEAALAVGKKLGKIIQIHVDQKNHPDERMTEMLVNAVRKIGDLP